MKTERLFDQDPYQKECSATLIHSKDVFGHQGVILDQTLFFPNSGGQPADFGTIENVPILDVFEEENSIVHVLKEKLVKKMYVVEKIDWNRRFDHMQQHSGQHILSQAFIQTLNAETIGFHMGKESSTIDLNIHVLNKEDAEKTETLANHVVFENRSIHILNVSSDELNRYPLRKIPQTGQRIRIVEIDGFDWSGCCGTHVRMSGEIGLIKITRWERYKNRTRVYFLCGERSLSDYHNKIETVKEVCKTLTVGEQEIIPTLIRMQEEKKIKEKKIRDLLDQAQEHEARILYEKSKVNRSYRLVTNIFDGREPIEVQSLVKEIILFPDVVAIIGLRNERGYLYFARSPSIDIDMQNLMQKILKETEWKGGGSASMIQASGADPSLIQSLIDRANQILSKN